MSEEELHLAAEAEAHNILGRKIHGLLQACQYDEALRLYEQECRDW